MAQQVTPPLSLVWERLPSGRFSIAVAARGHDGAETPFVLFVLDEEEEGALLDDLSAAHLRVATAMPAQRLGR